MAGQLPEYLKEIGGLDLNLVQSGNLILKSRNRRFLPVFFSKEDLDLALRKAFQQQKRSNPALKVNTDIQVSLWGGCCLTQ